MAPRTGLPNENGGPVLFVAFELAPYVKAVIRALQFSAIFRPFNSPASPDVLFLAAVRGPIFATHVIESDRLIVRSGESGEPERRNAMQRADLVVTVSP